MAQRFSSSLPAPEGPFQVGFHDIMIHGEPDSSTDVEEIRFRSQLFINHKMIIIVDKYGR